MVERTTTADTTTLFLKLFPGEGVRLTLSAEAAGKGTTLSVNLPTADVRKLRDDLSLMLVKLPQ